MKTKIILAISILLLGMLFGYFIGKPKEVSLPEVDLSLLKSHVIDSMNDVRLKEKQLELDSKTQVVEKAIGARKQNITKQKAKVEQAVEIYKEDPVQEKCDSALYAYYVLTDSLTTQVNDYDSIVKLKDKKLDLFKEQVQSKNSVIENSNRNIERLQKEIANQNSWWSRNKKWVYFIGGIGTGAYTIYKLK